MNTLVRIALASSLFAAVAAAQTVPAALEASARKLEGEFATFGMKFDAPVPLQALGGGEFGSAAQTELEWTYGAHWFELQHFLRDGLGIDSGKNPAEVRARLAQDALQSVPVFYRSATKSVVIDSSRIADDLRAEQDLAAALVLAWRDRQSGLDQLYGSPRETEHATLMRALAVGEADVAALAITETRAGRKLEDLEIDSLANPLPDGVGDDFTRLLHKFGRDAVLLRQRSFGWDGVRSYYLEAPRTVEQLMHASKLYRDNPKKVPMPQWPAQLGLELVREDTLGELSLFTLLLGAGVERSEAQLAAIGWDGDRIQLLRTANGERVLVARLVFDRPEDVKQFGAAFTPKALGQAVARGFTVDWVRSESIALVQPMLDLLAQTKIGATRNPEDEESTAEIERGLVAALDPRPRIDNGTWRLPRYELSIPVPDGWEMETIKGQPFLMGPQIDTFKNNITVVALDNLRGASIEDALTQQKNMVTAQPDLVFDSSEKRTHDGREIGYVRYHGKTGGQDLQFTALTFVQGGRPVVVTATVAQATWEYSRPAIEKCIAGIRFHSARSFDSK